MKKTAPRNAGCFLRLMWDYKHAVFEPSMRTVQSQRKKKGSEAEPQGEAAWPPHPELQSGSGFHTCSPRAPLQVQAAR